MSSIAWPIARTVLEVSVARGAARAEAEALVGAPDVDDRIPIERLYALWEYALDATRDPGLPIHVGLAARLARLGVLGYALHVSPTLEVAVRRLCRYSRLATDSGVWTVRVDGEHLVIAWQRAADRRGARAANEQTLAAFATLAREVHPALELIEVRHRHAAPASTTAHAAHYAAPVHWTATEDALVCSREILGLQPAGADRALDEIFAHALDRSQAVASDPLAVATARVVLALLPDGIPELSAVARRLDTSERTLRRKLVSIGTPYKQLVEALQRERAIALIGIGSSITETSLAVGFSEVSAFTRAFRRWTNVPPSEFRRRTS